MNIKNKLAEELAKASKEKGKKDLEKKALELEAIELFRPIAEALEELKNELSEIDGLSITVGKNKTRVKLGDLTTLESCRYFFTNKFSVDEKNSWGELSYDTTERTHRFESSQQVIDFFIKECAQYVARSKKD